MILCEDELQPRFQTNCRTELFIGSKDQRAGGRCKLGRRHSRSGRVITCFWRGRPCKAAACFARQLRSQAPPTERQLSVHSPPQARSQSRPAARQATSWRVRCDTRRAWARFLMSLTLRNPQTLAALKADLRQQLVAQLRIKPEVQEEYRASGDPAGYCGLARGPVPTAFAEEQRDSCAPPIH